MKILFVEDMEAFQSKWMRNIADLNLGVQCLAAYNLTEARTLFVDNPDIEVIAVDGSLENGENGLDFIAEIREKFSGKIIAASGSRETCLTMVRLGADFSCNGNKERVSEIIKDFLATRTT